MKFNFELCLHGGCAFLFGLVEELFSRPFNFFFKKPQASLKIEINIFYVVSSVHIMQMAFA